MKNLEESKFIANKILKQISYDIPVYWSWGVSEKVMMHAGSVEDDKYQLGGLIIKVNGKKFKGKVCIRLMASDTYTVELWQDKRRSKSNPLGLPERIKKLEDIYCDELMHKIDQEIET